MRSAIANAWLRPAPDAPPDRQVLVGDDFAVETTRDGWHFGRAEKDGYPGWLPDNALGPMIAATHWVSVRTTWAYAAPDIKATPLIDLHMTSRIEVCAEEGDWLTIRQDEGLAHVPRAHCRTIGNVRASPVEAARAFLGTPYLWAGNTGFGLDCSGLVQIAYHAAGRDCAADSGQQETMAGNAVAEDFQPGDLIFWKGHVAMATDAHHIIHANAHHMAVVEEPLAEAITRIEATDAGPVTSRLRPD